MNDIIIKQPCELLPNVIVEHVTCGSSWSQNVYEALGNPTAPVRCPGCRQLVMCDEVRVS